MSRLKTIHERQEPTAGRCDGALTDEQLEAILRARIEAARKIAKGKARKGSR